MRGTTSSAALGLPGPPPPAPPDASHSYWLKSEWQTLYSGAASVVFERGNRVYRTTTHPDVNRLQSTVSRSELPGEVFGDYATNPLT